MLPSSSGPRVRGRAEEELRALFDEVAVIDWAQPSWRGLLAALAASEVWQGRQFAADLASEAFGRALEANGGPTADTFMATHAPAPPVDRAGRIELAVSRAISLARTLRAQDRAAPGQRLLQAMHLERGWLRGRALPDAAHVPIAFVANEASYLARVDPDDPDQKRRLVAQLRDGALPRIDRGASEPTRAAAAVALEPVSLDWARSFQRAAWTRGGGPWIGVADAPPFSVVSTCHAAVDGYAHARVCADVLSPSAAHSSRLAPDPFPGVPGVSPPSVGFAARSIVGAPPRFAAAMRAFASVLDRRLGGNEARSVPFHVPIAPGHRAESARWRRRSLYGLMALAKDADGRLESVETLAARLPAFLAREAEGRGLLTRVLRAALELPLPPALLRLVVARNPRADRYFAPAQVLTGGGYISWMRFPKGEEPRFPTYPSAVPSFSVEGRGGAGLSIAPFSSGLAVGLTTSGTLGTRAVAEQMIDEWADALASASEEAACIA